MSVSLGEPYAMSAARGLGLYHGAAGKTATVLERTDHTNSNVSDIQEQS